LNTFKEVVEVHAKVIQEDRQGRDGRHGAPVLDGADERPAERRRDRCLAETRLDPPPPQFVPDRRRQPPISWMLPNT